MTSGINHSPKYGNFGLVKNYYDLGRKGFPVQVFSYLESIVGELSRKEILDIGCGTGISSRQIASRNALVTGVDIDTEMIGEARRLSTDINYCVAPAKNLPFIENRFDIVTAFSAFHWFSSEKEIIEIKRVLKPNGVFFVINKNDDDLLPRFRKILSTFVPHELPNIKRDYDPPSILTRNNFFQIQQQVFTTEEKYSFDEAISYLQSVSLWNLVPKREKNKALKSIKEFCERSADQNIIKKKVMVVAVIGRVKK